jgi:magnesium transporter
MNKTAQLYSYNADVVDLVEKDVKYFVDHFDPMKNLNYTMWLNIHSLEDKESIHKLCDKLGIDTLIQEAIFCGTKRPRLEEYPDYAFFTIESALPTTTEKFELKKERLSFIVGDNYLVSFQNTKSGHFPNVRDRIEHKRGKIRYKGPDFLLYRLMEAINDNYIEVVEDSSEAIVQLDKLVLKYPTSEVLRRIEWEKRKLIDLRKTVQPMRDVLLQIERVENKLIIEENSQYFLELKDTCLTLLEEIDAQKQMLDGIANLYYAVQGQKMNEIMKVLTVISAIFIPLTFIVGVYGMNFENMPELKWKYGYFFTIGFMVLLTAVLVFVFWKRGWLRRDAK